MKLKALLISLIVLAPSNALCEEILIPADAIKVIYNNKRETQNHEIAQEIVVNNKRLFTEIKGKENTGKLSLSLVSRVRTEIKIKVNDDTLGFIGSERDQYELFPNVVRNFNFLAYGPTTGVITVYNMNDEILAEVPYMVKHAKTVRNNITITGNTNLNDIDPSIGISYSHSQIKSYNDEGRWTFRTSVSGIGADTQRLSVGTTYSW